MNHVRCPKCSARFSARDKVCPECGIDIAIFLGNEINKLITSDVVRCEMEGVKNITDGHGMN